MHTFSCRLSLILIGLSFIVPSNEGLLIGRGLCDFLDSVDISRGKFIHSNKSILFNGIEFADGQYAQVHYIMKDGAPFTVDPYYRGCPCTTRPCIRLCCPYGSFVVNKTFDGEFHCREDEAAKNIQNEVINENNETEIINFEKHFGLVNRVCSNHFYAEEFQITKNGEVLSEGERHDHRGSCLEVKQNGTQVDLRALICFETVDEFHVRYRILPYVMLASIPFIIATIVVYVLIPDLMSLMGKCLVCFLTCLLIHYSALSYVQLSAGGFIEKIPCTVLAYTIYFTYLSAALWLNVISFNVWQSFRFMTKTWKYSEREQFLFCVAYVFSFSTILTVAFGVIDSMPSIPNDLRPGFATINCFIKEDKTSKFLYFYLQLCIIFSVNIVFFVLTALKIRHVNQELKTRLAGHQSSFNRKKCSYIVHLRLLIVMGVTWTLDAISFIDPDGIYFLISDICNGAQGMAIFTLFVLKKRIFLQIKERWNHLLGVKDASIAVSLSTIDEKM